MPDGKYASFKTGELQAWAEDIHLAGEAYASLQKLMLPDAVVIRKQDVVSEAGLAAYAGAARGIAAVLQQEAPGRDIEGLNVIAEYFDGEADSASTWDIKKIPD